MSTYAVIAIKRPNGTVNLARLLQDGVPADAGAILSSSYKTTEQVEALIVLGEILTLDTTPEKSTLKKSGLPGYVRDEGMLVRNFDMTHFIYLFDNGKWRYFDTFGSTEWHELNTASSNE